MSARTKARKRALDILFQADVRRWAEWNRTNIASLGKSQQANGSWNDQNGTLFGTSAALLSLALNYRYLPIYER